MKFYSTNNREWKVSFEQAVFESLPPDRGLYMPEHIPTLDRLFIRNLPALSVPEIALEVMGKFVTERIPREELKKIVEEAFDFPAPVQALTPSLAVLELFHGPSLAFKDFGARFMSRVMGYLSQQREGILDVLVATSGDTGGAVAMGFLGVEGTRVTILYPKGKVSPIQELQLTTHGQNIRAIEVEGTFDDCQALVKKAFLDEELHTALNLTSANSINISRLLPQTVYYFHAYGQMLAQGMRDVVFVVPSGNFGNIGAGLLAHKMGLPAQRFVAATNANDTVPRFLKTGQYETVKAISTISNAMDVADPSNWVRIIDLFGGNSERLMEKLSAYAFTDEQTRKGMEMLFDQHGYLACPHTAVAWLAAEAYQNEYPGEYASVFLSTAHPCKFPEAFPGRLRKSISVPAQVKGLSSRQSEKIAMTNDFNVFKRYLLERGESVN